MPARHLQLIAPPSDGVDAPCLRIAFATNDLRTLDAHFGSARHFAIYDVTPSAIRFAEAVNFDEVSGPISPDAGTDRIATRVAALSGCHLLFVLAIGGPAAAQVVNAHVHPVKLAGEEPVMSIIGRVQAMMQGNPPLWLRRLMLPGHDQCSMDSFDEVG